MGTSRTPLGATPHSLEGHGSTYSTERTVHVETAVRPRVPVTMSSHSIPLPAQT